MTTIGIKSCSLANGVIVKNVFKRIPVRMLAALALMVGTSVALAAPAQAVTCYGDYCSGQDPESTGCSADAFTTTSYNNSQFSLQVRWSPTCKTNWTRLTMYSPGFWGCSSSGQFYAVQQNTNYTKSKYFASYCGDATITKWTPMIYSPVHAVRGKFVDQNNATYWTPWS